MTALERTRELRRNSTEAENLLWQALRNNHLDVKFRRQVAIGPYIADFICHELNLIVEADGGQHCESAHDAERTKFMNSEGFDVLRFWNNEITDNLEGVITVLKEKIRSKEST